MADIFREVTHIWPYRRPAHNPNTLIWSYTIAVDCNATHDDVVHEFRDFHPFLPGHCVRIPALMLHYTPNPANLSKQEALEQSWDNRPMREEPKQHVYVDSHYRQLQQVQNYWRRQPVQANQPPVQDLCYGAVTTINGVYPCFKQVANCPQPVDMVFGVCFCRRSRNNNMDIITYTRTYLRHDLEDVESELAFDITQDFINANANPNAPTTHYQNPLLFHNVMDYERQNSVAFYVCRGARLLVSDGRSAGGYEGEEGHDRALYQAGSLVVCTGTRGIYIESTTHDGSRVSIGWNGFHYRLGVRTVRLLQPVGKMTRNLDDWELQRDPGNRLNDFKDEVIFLGAIESEFNSACWRILIQDNDDIDFCQIWLAVPNQGIIEDIAPWNSGFELIRARQQYEQPWRAVVKYQANTRVPQFVVPNEPEYVIPRILGLGEGGPFWINYPYYRYRLPRLARFQLQHSIQRYMADYISSYNQVLHPINMPSLRHFEQLTEWHTSAWKDVMSPPAPPLLPPVKSAQSYIYLPPETKVTIAGKVGDDIVFDVPGYQGQYHLIYEDNIPGHKWVNWTKENNDQVKQHNQNNPNYDPTEWLRCSVDHMVYLKMPEDLTYKTKMLVLEKIQ